MKQGSPKKDTKYVDRAIDAAQTNIGNLYNDAKEYASHLNEDKSKITEGDLVVPKEYVLKADE